MHVILGELVPKSLALQRAEQVALAVAAPMDVWLTLTRPLIFVMGRSAGWVLKVFGLRRVRQGPVHSPDEVKLIVSASRELGQLPPLRKTWSIMRWSLKTLLCVKSWFRAPIFFLCPAISRCKMQLTAWSRNSTRGSRFTIPKAGLNISSAFFIQKT